MEDGANRGLGLARFGRLINTIKLQNQTAETLSCIDLTFSLPVWFDNPGCANYPKT